MKLLCLATFLATYLVHSAAENSLFNAGSISAAMGGMKAMPLPIPQQCKDLAEKKADQVANALWDKWLKPKCKNAKCKPTYHELKKYWKQIRMTTEAVVTKIKDFKAKDPKSGKEVYFDFNNLPAQCKVFQQYANWQKVWSIAQELVNKCIFKPGPGHTELVNLKDYCNINEKEVQKTAGCFKSEVTAQIPKYSKHLFDAIPCATYALDTYCNDAHMGKWVDYNTKNAFKDRSIYGKLNPFQALEDFFDKYNCVAHPVAPNAPGETD